MRDGPGDPEVGTLLLRLVPYCPPAAGSSAAGVRATNPVRKSCGAASYKRLMDGAWL
jgi:hypothetical protein